MPTAIDEASRVRSALLLSSAEQDAERAVRAQRLAGALRSAGVEVQCASVGSDDSGSGPRVELDRQDGTGNATVTLTLGEVLETRDLALAVDVDAAQRLAEADPRFPLWLDLADVALSTAAFTGDLETRQTLWRGYTWVLDRFDFFTCGDDATHRALLLQLGVRGRLLGEQDGGALVHVLALDTPEAALPSGPSAWLRSPARSGSFGGDAPLMTRREFALADEINRLAQVIVHERQYLSGRHQEETARLEQALAEAATPAPRALRAPAGGSVLRRGWTHAYRVADAVRQPFRRPTRVGVRLLTTGYATLAVGARFLRARLRSATAAWPDRAPAPVPTRRPRILMVYPYRLVPVDHGGAVRATNLLRLLARDCDVHLLVFSREGEDASQRQELGELCAGVYFHPWQPQFTRPPWSLTPPSAALFASDDAARTIRDLANELAIDVLHLEFTEMGQYRHCAPAGVPVLLVEIDIAFRSLARRRRYGFSRRFPDSGSFGATFGDWLRLVRFELAACREADQVHVMSRADGNYLARLLPDRARRLHVVPNAVDTAHFAPPEDVLPSTRRGVLFVGNFQHLPNLDALEHLLAEIWPLVRAEEPEATLAVVGAEMPDSVRAADGRDGVTVVGRVADMGATYHRYRVLAVPLRTGSGTRLKLLEGFAAGIPAVSTSLGAEGLDGRHDEHLLLAETPASFADALVRVLRDDALASRLATAARDLVRARYDWSASASAMLDGIHALIAEAGESRLGIRAQADTIQAARIGAPLPDAPPEIGWQQPPDVSVVIPTLRGGRLLDASLRAINRQRTSRRLEIVCVDSGSSDDELRMMKEHGARVVSIDKRTFDHGRTRDYAAALARGTVVVFINQDAVPADEHWLDRLTDPLFGDDPPAAVQGGIREFPYDAEPAVPRFYWDSLGNRFYFTRESEGWIARYGLGFSTVNAALRRDVWRRLPFGWAPIMEDKKWQRQAAAAGHTIADVPEAAVFHTHDYGMRSLVRRCLSEGWGWRLVGERYRLRDMARDMMSRRIARDWLGGVARGRVRTAAAFLFPWLRPLVLWYGNRWSRGVRL